MAVASETRSSVIGGISIVVPVYNEAARIAKSAAMLLDGLPPGTETIFVCNGCTDRSEEILKDIVGSRAEIMRLAVGDKAAAIRAAERKLTQFPRFYVDADVLVTGHAIVALAKVLERRKLELISPRAIPDFDSVSWPARAVHQVWHALPHGMNGAFHQVLGVSREGRSRWGEFPDVMADDSFIESRIPASRKAVDDLIYQVYAPPRTLWATVQVRKRWASGQRQLRSLDIEVPKARGQKRALLRLALSTRHSAGAFLYLGVRVCAQVLAVLPWRRRRGWFQDPTTRRPA